MKKQKLMIARRILFALTLAGIIAIPTATLRAQTSDEQTADQAAPQGGILNLLDHIRQKQAQLIEGSWEELMDKPRIFLGSSGKQEKLIQALTRGLEDVAHVVPWTTSFNPGTTTLERLLELTHEVDFAAFVFAQDDWTTNSPLASPLPASGQASPRDNVVFEAGLFGGVLGMRRTFILHASGSKLPSDLLGFTSGTAERPPRP